jgi:hypothetical protein
VGMDRSGMVGLSTGRVARQICAGALRRIWQACRQRRIDKNPGKAVFVAGARRPVVYSQVLSYGQGRELAL